MKVVIIGAGNVASVLGRLIKKGGHQIVQIVHRGTDRGIGLARQLHAASTDDLLELDLQADIYLLAISDQNINGVVSQLPACRGIFVHTAGSVTKDVFKNEVDNYGVLYPLQTLNSRVEDLPPVPLLIDGNSEAVKETLYEFATSWSSRVDFATDDKRMATHVAAVMVNNFTNHLMALTEGYCLKENIDFQLLLPLLYQTIQQLGTMPAALMQTGPAARGDISTIDKHLQLLNRQPQLRNLYLKLSESIITNKNRLP